MRPGAFVEVHIPDRIYEDVIRIPKSAVHEGGIVYRIEGDRLEPEKVKVVVRDGADLLIRAEISDDELIVTSRFAEIGPGIRVRVP